VTHGLALVRNRIKRRTRRGRSYVDKRTHEGQEALRIQAGLVDDQGGVDAISAARFIVIQELTLLYYLGAMMDRSIATFILDHPEAKNARTLARLFSYRMPVTNTRSTWTFSVSTRSHHQQSRSKKYSQRIKTNRRHKHGNQTGIGASSIRAEAQSKTRERRFGK
jgi:hypothetical protein